jgi:hypothetical protein
MSDYSLKYVNSFLKELIKIEIESDYILKKEKCWWT